MGLVKPNPASHNGRVFVLMEGRQSRASRRKDRLPEEPRGWLPGACDEPHAAVPLGMEACELYDCEPSECSSDRYKWLPALELWSRHWSVQREAAQCFQHGDRLLVAVGCHPVQLFPTSLPFDLICAGCQANHCQISNWTVHIGRKVESSLLH